MRKNTRMEEITKKAIQLASFVVPNHSVGTCKPCLSLKYGDISLGRCTSITTEEEEELRKLCVRHGNNLFTGAKINPQRQLCLSLNRPIIFQQSIPEILNESILQGCHGDHEKHQLLVMEYLMQSLRSAGNEGGMVGSPHHQQQLSVSEARIILTGGLLRSILMTSEPRPHPRNHTHLSLTDCMRLDEDDTVIKFLDSFSNFNVSTDGRNETEEQREEGMKAGEEQERIEEENGKEKEEERMEEFLRKVESSQYVTRSVRGSECSAKDYLLKHGRSQYYDSNIATIRVRDEDGRVTPVTRLACKIYHTKMKLRITGARDVRFLCVTSPSDSFRLQQALVLCEVHDDSAMLSPSLDDQKITLCSKVEVSEGGQVVKDFPLNKLLEIRRRQMTKAFRVKHGTIADTDDEIQAVVQATTEAVVKFELLSTDLNNKVKLRVPPSSDSEKDNTSEFSDIRFAGSFVLYNYARLAGLVRNFETASRLGTYPPLPELSEIDFSLLTDEEEWMIFYQYLLQFPVLVRELADTIYQSPTLHCQIKLKKICQFLLQLSHAVSTYYSRVKILMSPEPHLVPLIHARLMLILAIKQTLHSGLKLLAILPPKQL